MRRELLRRLGLRSTRVLPSVDYVSAHRATILLILLGWSASVKACA